MCERAVLTNRPSLGLSPFVLAVFGLGMGFHGPAVYLHAVHESTGWPLALISTAITVHFLVGAAPALFIVAGIVQGLAICAFLAGRRRA